jgi:hypothetical protein
VPFCLWIDELLVSVDFGDAQALEPFGVILAVEDVPLFAALEDLFFLRTNFRADVRVYLLLKFEKRGDNGDDFLANSVAVLDKIDFRTGNKKVDDAMGEANRFFAGESHISGELISFRGQADPSLS